MSTNKYGIELYRIICGSYHCRPGRLSVCRRPAPRITSRAVSVKSLTRSPAVVPLTEPTTGARSVLASQQLCYQGHRPSRIYLLLHIGRGGDRIDIRKQGTRALLAKADIKHALRLIPVRRDRWSLLGYQWNRLCYFDSRLSFES